MRTDYLSYLIDIAQTKSINISAKQLYISQQRLSRAIKTLESELGVTLLHRHHYGVELTEVGEIIVNRAKVIVAQIYEMEKDAMPYLKKANEDITGNLKININYHIVNEVLNTIINTFSVRSPNVKLTISDVGVADTIKDINEGRADIALIGTWNGFPYGYDFDEEMKNIEYEELYRADILVCVSKKLPLARKKVVSPSQLLEYPLLEFTNQTVTERVFAGIGTPKVLLETDSTELFKKMIYNGLGYGFTNTLDWKEDYCFDEKEELVVIPVDHEEAVICYGLLYQKDKKDLPLYREFLDISRERFELIKKPTINH